MDYKAKELHFYGHDTFPLRHRWLPKAVKHVRETNNLSDYYSIMTEQGLGRNMAKSMRHWAESTKIVMHNHKTKEHYITHVGNIIFGEQGDKYLQYSDTIWLIHYLLVTNHKKNALWYYLFNCYGGNAFTKDSFITAIRAWLEKIEHPNPPGKKQLERDFNCCMNMYCLSDLKKKRNIDEYISSPFNQLQLIYQKRGEYRIRSMSSMEVSEQMFTYCLLNYLQLYDNKTVPFTDILHGEKSPGKVFNLTENTLVDYIEGFVKKIKNTFEFETTAGMRSLFRLGPFPKNIDTYLKKAFKIVS